MAFSADKNTSERRRAERFNANEIVCIEVISGSDTLDEMADILFAETIDLSSKGLQIKTNQPLEEGMIFDFCIQLKSVPRKFMLTGEVRWSGKLEDDAYKAGIYILDTVDSDYGDWTILFKGN